MKKSRVDEIIGINYEIWDTPILGISDFNKLTALDKLRYLCNFSHMAPSSHNTQPWRFFLDEKKLEIEMYLDKSYILPVSDVVGRQAMVSMGCALEYLVIAGAYFQLKVHVIEYEIKPNQILPSKKIKNDESLIKIAKIVLSEDGKSENISKKMLQSILKRKVMRAEFDPTSIIPKALTSELENTALQNGVKLISLISPVRRLALAEFQGQADGYVINSSKFAKELGNWLLPNDSRSGLGMPGIGFGLKEDQAIRMHKGLLGLQNLEPEDGLRFALGGKMALEKSPFIGLLTVSKDVPADWLKAGRTLGKIFLLLEQSGFSSAVHAAIVEVGLINRIFAASLGTADKLVAVFRAGKVKDLENLSRPHAPRLPLNEIILNYKS